MKKLKEYIVPICITLIGGLLIFYKLGEVSLIEWDESIYAQIAKNVIKSGSWLDFKWFPQAESFWFEKPPIYIWATALSYLIFGVNEFAARFPSALLGTLGIFVTYLFGRELFNRRVGLISSIVLASTIHWVFQSRNGTMDVAVGFFSLLSLYYFWKGRSSNRLLFWGLSGASLGLALMTKGAIFIIPAIVMGLYMAFEIFIVKSEGYKFYIKPFLVLAACFLLISLPWHIIMLVRHGGDFWQNYFGYHVLARTKGIEGHANPFFWYRVVIRHWFKHWYLVLLAAIPTLGYSIIKNYKERKEEVFLFLWAGVTFLIFSSSVSKIQWYIIPIYPALALINGRFLEVLAESVFVKGRLKRIKEKLWGLSFVALFISIPVFMVLIPDFRDQWRISNYLKGLKSASIYMSDISNEDDVLYVFELAPGPPLFYSDRDNMSIGKGQVLAFLKDSDRLFVLMREDAYINNFMEEPIVKKYGKVFFNENGYILLGKVGN